jgi:hypothetical protein
MMCKAAIRKRAHITSQDNAAYIDDSPGSYRSDKAGTSGPWYKGYPVDSSDGAMRMIICAGTRDGDRPGHDMSAFGG